jgi:hypothetical protein
MTSGNWSTSTRQKASDHGGGGYPQPSYKTGSKQKTSPRTIQIKTQYMTKSALVTNFPREKKGKNGA